MIKEIPPYPFLPELLISAQKECLSLKEICYTLNTNSHRKYQKNQNWQSEPTRAKDFSVKICSFTAQKLVAKLTSQKLFQNLIHGLFW